ncbi:PucR family transcriptional regulator [Pseudomonas sp. 10-1B]|uniref:PucR family transcriptional regulator n=1 Tax=Pseudomonas sp. 10-1B TaxID=1546029 RepID=UPI00061F9017|nr:PucR family transcriptional regulator [Pseudomonas sp. 10-1B]KIY40666.1 PucR family transcriptional regulator [Pseudomonas sp. 10-1B]
MLTVHDLIAIDPLKLQVLAGLAGTSRIITWAHTVDLPDPWRWVSPGDLVMTTGVGMPIGDSAQVEWLEKLAQSNASAVVIAPREDAPALSPGLLEAAERLLFPLLHASFELEFVKLSHYVIESVLQAQRERFNASERLFQTYAQALRMAPDMPGRLSILAKNLGGHLAIEDAVTGIRIVESQPSGDQALVNIERIPIAGRTQANLIISRRPHVSMDDSILLRSLVGLLGVELERQMIHRDQQREEGAALLRSLLDSEVEPALTRPMLERRGLKGTLIALAIRPGSGSVRTPDDIHHAPALHVATPLLLAERNLLLAIGCDDSALFQALLEGLGQGTQIGISGPITTASGYREAARQSRLALTQAAELAVPTLRYGEAETGLIMAPKSLPEARALVARYLGPLIEHDRLQGATLLHTLTTFLKNDGNWKASALDLGIHRQTLVYRIKLVEQLTGFNPTTTQGIARFWIAIQAAINSDLLGLG